MPGTSETSKLRKFGLTVGGAFLLLGVIRGYFHAGYFATGLLAVGGALFVFGLVLPNALGPVEKGWMKMATALAYVNTRIILTVLFYLVFTPVGLVMRLVRDPLNRKLRDGSPSYWIKREEKSSSPMLYERQF
jgi:hypothetical protein